MFESLPLTTQFSVAKMRSEIKKDALCGRLVENRIVESVSPLFTAFRLSSLVDCLYSLTIDVDDADSIEPSLLAQPHSPGRVLQSPHAAKPVCAHSPSLSTGAARCRDHARWTNHSDGNQPQASKLEDERPIASTPSCETKPARRPLNLSTSDEVGAS
jgi:hypothetical protein